MNVKSMCSIALFIVLFFIFSNIIPPINIVGVPITLQTMLIMMVPFFLKTKEIILFFVTLVVATIIGIPLMAGFSSGIAVFFGPTAGYIYGWLPMMLFISLFVQKNNKLQLFIIMLVAILIDYVCGAFFFTLVNGGNVVDNFITLSGLFIFFDGIKAFIILSVVDKVPSMIKYQNNTI